MSQRLKYFLVVWMLMFAGNILGQDTPGVANSDSMHQGNKVYGDRLELTLSAGFKNQKPMINFITPVFITNYTPVKKTEIIYLKSYYIKTLGVVCKAEYQLQKAISIPLRLRLGSLDYTNYLEQKPNAVKLVY